jgi:hypothetical protein
MAGVQPIIVYPPTADGGRRVRIDGRFIGMAYGILDIVEFLRLTGLETADDEWVRQSGMIEWREGGPDIWKL